MKYFTLVIVVLMSYQSTLAQELSGNELLEKAIKHHDSDGNWATFNGQLQVTMKTPNNSNRNSRIIINLPKDYFQVSASRDSVITTYIIEKGKCSMLLSDSLRIANLKEKPQRSYCESANMYKNYYTYLYGLPMKLKDEGTIIHDKVERKTFKGKEYLVLKASYDENVGSDVWFFYFDPKTYAMEIYQFFKTDENGKLKLDSGEYILLTETKIINNIKMPRNRAWYYNKDDKYLGTDMLTD